MQDNISAIPCSCRPRAASTNLSNSCTCGFERFPSAQNDTFVDSELCSYTGDRVRPFSSFLIIIPRVKSSRSMYYLRISLNSLSAVIIGRTSQYPTHIPISSPQILITTRTPHFLAWISFLEFRHYF
ncbi:hypothetical protein TNCV_515971 [Trichonephila clavipes]|nr:hypothetical protein TNCV_515971 [Trichonephila clavipes]